MRCLTGHVARHAAALRIAALLALAVTAVSCTWAIKLAAGNATKAELKRDFVFPSMPPDAATCLDRCAGGSALALLPEMTTMIDLGPVEGSTDKARRARANLAVAAVNSRLQQDLVDFYNTCMKADKQAPPQLKLDLNDIEKQMRAVEAAATSDGWGALEEELRDRLQRMGAADRDGRANAQRGIRVAAFINAYTKAYFRDGQFFTAKLDVPGLTKQLQDQYDNELSQEQLDGLLRGLLGFDPSQRFFGKLGTKGLVTRGGQNFQFQNVEATINPATPQVFSVTAVDYARTGSDLVRVLVHATFDALSGLPAVADATGASAEALGSGAGAPLPVNKPGDNAGLSPKDFAAVEQIAAGVEGVVSAGVGRLIRGAGWVALNNEALAATVETLAGVTARKYAERFAWCYFSCRQGPKGGAPTSWGTTTVTVAVEVPREDLVGKARY